MCVDQLLVLHFPELHADGARGLPGAGEHPRAVLRAERAQPLDVARGGDVQDQPDL